MPKSLLYIIAIFWTVFLQAQQRDFWLIDKDTQTKNIVKDSAAAVKFLDSLAQTSYFFAKLHSVENKDQHTEIYYDKGPNFNQAQVKFSDSLQKEFNYPKEIYVKNLDSLKLKINQKYRDKGFAFNRVKTKFVEIKNDKPTIEISVVPAQQRRINSFVVRGYERVPKRFVKNLEKAYLGKVYDDKNLVAINKDLQGHTFVSLEKPPQTLFTKDSTQIYLFLQKKRVNNFDGMLGFGNDKTEKFTFNGTINIALRNMFNGFESISLYWQRNPDKGQTFDLQTDIPYTFKSNVGVNVGVNIYRQDSTFATVKFRPALYLHLSQNQKIGLRGTFESSAVLDSLYTQAQDFTKKGVGIWYQYQSGSEIPLFIYNTNIRAEVDFIKSNYDKTNLSVNQLRYFVSGEHNFHLKGNHYLNLRGESALLSAKNDLSVNELFRFGGWNSMRGFNELSLVSDFYAFGGAEYRYLVNDQAFFDVFAQYGTMSNKSLNASPSLYSLGLGFNFFLPVGLMSFQISNGNQFGNPFKFSETKIHWGIVSRF
ncbi:hypothetical protein SAMN05660477_01447 [Soonwooa buanensis]|uniref:Outer membrane translocation and assembly module TamA n=1 Tax=Soonwooa buanensis TaxID=619805 RepID=A0A1T5EJD2_9FLAO|nr:hypothetical protein [Soonwooa buanensis]SKB83858.1 hypothetical protein SAMN05660477_01447 [Soonwooa buanensis]